MLIGLTPYKQDESDEYDLFNAFCFLDECQGIIAGDEVDDDHDKLNIHKSGFCHGTGRISKINYWQNPQIRIACFVGQLSGLGDGCCYSSERVEHERPVQKTGQAVKGVDIPLETSVLIEYGQTHFNVSISNI